MLWQNHFLKELKFEKSSKNNLYVTTGSITCSL